MESFGWALVTILVLATAGYLVVDRLRKRMKTRREVVLGEMMDRHGLEMKRVVDHGLEDELVACARQCMNCQHYDTCLERMETEEKPAYCDICPNADFLDGLKGQQA
ncbi:DUF6455 family protein [Rhodobium gokarnense]|uniref:Positive regulator of sigma E activity n=1 Tax=Rhodobium gokarnense TaxID=364296 RepID=A0ABT3HAY2_9HYPH|nr:DUF6455 family protein [Rhodobium gokarnense]MCW2307535.1 positive regulator of sigma E activity [Rhodobium gokarnense]